MLALGGRAIRSRRPRSTRARAGSIAVAPACRFSRSPDLRYRNRVQRPEPISRAAMFCLMDVSRR
jgi:uncharacterized sporulation protein YeaH/YhbH (DUF444 family)